MSTEVNSSTWYCCFSGVCLSSVAKISLGRLLKILFLTCLTMETFRTLMWGQVLIFSGTNSYFWLCPPCSLCIPSCEGCQSLLERLELSRALGTPHFGLSQSCGHQGRNGILSKLGTVGNQPLSVMPIALCVIAAHSCWDKSDYFLALLSSFGRKGPC